MKVVLFDIDGTLMHGYGAGTRAMTRAGRAVCGAGFDLDGIMIGGGLDPVIYRQAALKMGLADPDLLHDGFRDRYFEELRIELNGAARRPHVLPGVVALLEALAAKSDVAVGLVTGNYRAAVEIKFSAIGLEHEFVAGGFGDDATTRPALVPIALERMRARLGGLPAMRDVIIVGDTPRDIDCALTNGCVCLAVATGGHSHAELEAAGAHRVAADLGDPRALLELL